MRLDQRTILITGATSGIGRELAMLLSQQGSDVVLCGRDAERLADVARITGGTPVQADLSCPSEVERLAYQVQRDHGRVSIVINNAACQFNYLFSELAPARVMQDIGSELQTDLAAPMQLAALLLPTLQQEALRTKQPSALVNLTSGLAMSPKKTAAVYCAAKSGLRTFTKALRFQLEAERRAGGADVRSIEAMLPLVDTPMTAGRGHGKITSSHAAAEIIAGLEREVDEIYVGKVRALRMLHRVLPSVAEHLFRNV